MVVILTSYKAWDDPLRRRHHQTGNYWVGDMLKNRKKKTGKTQTKHHPKKNAKKQKPWEKNGLKEKLKRENKKARNYTPPKINEFEPEVMMLWSRCFSEFPGGVLCILRWTMPFSSCNRCFYQAKQNGPIHAGDGL